MYQCSIVTTSTSNTLQYTLSIVIFIVAPRQVTLDVSSPSLFAGEPLTLTCSIDEEGQTIEWVGPDGMVVMSSEGVNVETVSSGGTTISVLTFSGISTSQAGSYTCRNPVENLIQEIEVKRNKNINIHLLVFH